VIRVLADGGLHDVRGFRAAGGHAGIKIRKRDLAILVSDRPGTAGAAVFTKNLVAAAPVVVSREHVAGGRLRAIVVNSGCANACTGEQGLADARTMAREAAKALGVPEGEVLVASTGVIGHYLPMDKVVHGIRDLAGSLRASAPGTAAEAIMTTDTAPKEAVAHGSGFSVGGMAKGSGMIHPQLATMLAVVTTDYPLDAGEALGFLAPAVHTSFNAISVDGECSTNDAVILLANGASRIERTPESDLELAACIKKVCGDLARQIVADGEGATVLAEIAVRGAASEGEARAIAERVATSPLVKTALYGHDANWGRIAAAAGSARFEGGLAALDPDRLSIAIDRVPVLVDGSPTGDEPELANGSCAIEIDLQLGDGAATYLTTDLSYEYVKINAEYRT
jgi:glutamate N-acetyltransferase/amino-acid N-acetyltransferase